MFPIQFSLSACSALLNGRKNVGKKPAFPNVEQRWPIAKVRIVELRKLSSSVNRARSAFKLIQIDDKYAFLQPGAVVIDCGASPGSWSQIAVERTNSDGRSPRKKKGEVIAVDLQPIHPLPGLTIVAPADFTHESTLKKLKEILNDRRVDVVMSDMSPRASGMKSLDQDVSLELCKSVFRYALEVLSPGKGVFLCKMIFGGDASSFMREVKSAFEAASFVKPAASLEDYSDIDYEEEEVEEEDKGEEIVVKGSIQFSLVPKEAIAADGVVVSKTKVPPISETPTNELASAVLTAPDGSIVYLIGTVHFSRESQEIVKEVISRVRPRVVVLELCRERRALLDIDEETLLENAKNINIDAILHAVRTVGVFSACLHVMLLKISAEVTKVCGMAPGGEFRCAASERICVLKARKLGRCILNLGDRPIDITLKRAFHSLSCWRKLKLLYHVLFQSEKITQDDVNKCLRPDAVKDVMEELTKEFPELCKVFIDERDLYLAHSLQIAASKEFVHSCFSVPGQARELMDEPHAVVGVVGMGHVQGIVEQFGKVSPADAEKVSKLPPPSRTYALMRVTLKVTVIAGIVYGVHKLVPKPAFLSWDNFNSGLERACTGVKNATGLDFKALPHQVGGRVSAFAESFAKRSHI
ncbi:unnamed protein product [Notodromas monacha]|uniref:Ribosomal RNA methyltransferase FtsJ domain-containing protein n=1 Tax=Notodromas monacha TaxID=399045 RepID=A0A7R9GID5_9CRUS|nr:unnamed protein product [Notodromas monacha]CAG0921649.1 unnamed protein product [Notodromas monacha]